MKTVSSNADINESLHFDKFDTVTSFDGQEIVAPIQFYFEKPNVD